MAFRFKQANCVVVGTFNMYIIQPAWLTKIGVLPDGKQVEMMFNLEEAGLRFKDDDFQWTITPNRVAVETTSPAKDCGKLVARVLEELPWTPVVAVGNNAEYEGEKADLSQVSASIRECTLPEAPTGYTTNQFTHHVALNKDDRTWNLQVGRQAQSIPVYVNVHTPVRGKPRELARSAANRFVIDQQESERLLHVLFGVQVKHGSSND